MLSYHEVPIKLGYAGPDQAVKKLVEDLERQLNRVLSETSWSIQEVNNALTGEAPEGLGFLTSATDIVSNDRVIGTRVEVQAQQHSDLYELRWKREGDPDSAWKYQVQASPNISVEVVPPGPIEIQMRYRPTPLSEWSDWTDVVTVSPAKTEAVLNPASNLSVQEAEKGILLTWSIAKVWQYQQIRVYRNTSNDFSTATAIADLDGLSTKYLDQDATALTDLWYWVVGVTEDGLESDEVGPAGPIQRGTVAHLNVVEGSGQDVATITDCESTTGWSVESGAGVTIDVGQPYEGTYSLKISIPTGVTAVVRYTPASTLDFTTRDILSWWIRRSNARMEATYTVRIHDTVNGTSSVEKSRPYTADQWYRHSWITSGNDASVDYIEFEITAKSTGSVNVFIDLVKQRTSTPPTRVVATFPGGTINMYPPICHGNGPFPLKGSTVYSQNTGTVTETVPDGEVWHIDVVRAGTNSYIQVNGNTITAVDEDVYLNGCWLGPGDTLAMVTGGNRLTVLVSKYELVDYAVPLAGATLVDGTTSYTVPDGNILEITRIDGLASNNLTWWDSAGSTYRALVTAGLDEDPKRLLIDEGEVIAGGGTLYLFGILWRLKED
jgi:hypothetical protein